MCGDRKGCILYINTASVVSSVSVFPHFPENRDNAALSAAAAGPGRGHWYTGDTQSATLILPGHKQLVWFLLLPTVDNTTLNILVLQTSFLEYFPAVAIVKVLHAACCMEMLYPLIEISSIHIHIIYWWMFGIETMFRLIFIAAKKGPCNNPRSMELIF